jgi:heme-degrading monooxygenase HmoA
MFARQTTFHYRINELDKAVEIVKESIVPAAKSQKGYHGFHFMVDRKTGKAVAIVIWDSEEDAIANEESHYYQEQLVKTMRFYREPPIREGYEIVIQE